MNSDPSLNFVTVINSKYLPQAIALHQSMINRILNPFRLWIICVDVDTFEFLTKLELTGVELIELTRVETKELLKVKTKRTVGEYCWTLTPFAPKFVFDLHPDVQVVTYIDADLFFLKDVSPIFDEFYLSRKKVLITRHGYAPDYDQSLNSGIFCVQFITFKRDAEIVRTWWEAKCLDWCYAYFDSGRFGDQKYLEEFPMRFPEEVHVLKQQEFALAPWNALRYPISEGLFYHFHGAKLDRRNKLSIGPYDIPVVVAAELYQEYRIALLNAVKRLKMVGFSWSDYEESVGFKTWLKRRIKKIQRKKNAFKGLVRN